MSINKEYGKYCITCDGGCDCWVEIESFDTWGEAFDYAKDEGWLIKKVNGEWTHTCPECQDD